MFSLQRNELFLQFYLLNVNKTEYWYTLFQISLPNKLGNYITTNTMKISNKLFWSILPLTILFFTACEKNTPEIPNEEELITTLIYTLTPDSGGDVVTLSFKDLDGDGGDAPEVTSGILQANTTYTGSLSLLNEAETPAENINEEIEEEQEEHQFFFLVTTDLNISVDYADKDSNDQPLGLQTSLTTGDASQGQFTVVLRHEPDKSADGVASGSIDNAGGETDIEAAFNVEIQ